MEGTIHSIPLEILRKIISYSNQITLLMLYNTCKIFNKHVDIYARSRFDSKTLGSTFTHLERYCVKNLAVPGLIFDNIVSRGWKVASWEETFVSQATISLITWLREAKVVAMDQDDLCRAFK